MQFDDILKKWGKRQGSASLANCCNMAQGRTQKHSCSVQQLVIGGMSKLLHTPQIKDWARLDGTPRWSYMRWHSTHTLLQPSVWPLGWLLPSSAIMAWGAYPAGPILAAGLRAANV